jgi:hypothetical protein
VPSPHRLFKNSSSVPCAKVKKNHGMKPATIDERQRFFKFTFLKKLFRGAYFLVSILKPVKR